MNLRRLLRHLIAPHWLARRAFPAATLAEIEAAVAAAERLTPPGGAAGQKIGEVRFVVEAGLPWATLWHDLTARQRAGEVFAQLRVWDTEHNNGVLIYVQVVDRCVEIVADRGISARVEQSAWEAICHGMETAFRAGDYRRGAIEAIQRVGALLAASQMAVNNGKPIENIGIQSEVEVENELSDQPLLL